MDINFFSQRILYFITIQIKISFVFRFSSLGRPFRTLLRYCESTFVWSISSCFRCCSVEQHKTEIKLEIKRNNRTDKSSIQIIFLPFASIESSIANASFAKQNRFRYCICHLYSYCCDNNTLSVAVQKLFFLAQSPMSIVPAVSPIRLLADFSFASTRFLLPLSFNQTKFSIRTAQKKPFSSLQILNAHIENGEWKR